MAWRCLINKVSHALLALPIVLDVWIQAISTVPVPYKAMLASISSPGKGNCESYKRVGNASHFDAVHVYGTFCLNEAMEQGRFPLTGQGTQVAAIGDELYFAVDEVVDFNTDPPTTGGTFMFTGGMGRFENALGGGTIHSMAIDNDNGSFTLHVEYKDTIQF